MSISKEKNSRARDTFWGVTGATFVIFFYISIAIYFIIGTIKRGGGLSGFLATALGQSSEEIERALNLPVLAGIPDYHFDDEKKGGK